MSSKTWTFRTFGEDGRTVSTHENLSNEEAASLINRAIRGGAEGARHAAPSRDEEKVAELAPREELELVA